MVLVTIQFLALPDMERPLLAAFKVFVEQGDPYPATVENESCMRYAMGKFILMGKDENLANIIAPRKPLEYEYFRELVNDDFTAYSKIGKLQGRMTDPLKGILEDPPTQFGHLVFRKKMHEFGFGMAHCVTVVVETLMVVEALRKITDGTMYAFVNGNVSDVVGTCFVEIPKATRLWDSNWPNLP